jgi:hypothetical protein
VILLALNEDANVDLSIYDISGRMVSRPVSGDISAGSHQIPVEDLSSGIYYARCRTGSSTSVRSFMVLR